MLSVEDTSRQDQWRRVGSPVLCKMLREQAHGLGFGLPGIHDATKRNVNSLQISQAEIQKVRIPIEIQTNLRWVNGDRQLAVQGADLVDFLTAWTIVALIPHTSLITPPEPGPAMFYRECVDLLDDLSFHLVSQLSLPSRHDNRVMHYGPPLPICQKLHHHILCCSALMQVLLQYLHIHFTLAGIVEYDMLKIWQVNN